ncbi:Appr-1-p processing protein [Gallibacterium anatis]|uniref:type II toxin-antitoxin system antitoxin DNA ADP-ribosyl glycohydrolase DarG n=1 Tax=Gallibacterium anatis TaxID=750 RepID=UPI0005322EE4|nr:macro domain-containing protein [Gallibacterium anatis]KGQ35367.1 Appr-1-p processing protein [Gallibacterium anatis]
MIEYQTGNIFESQAEALVNTVNCVGVMGRGLALQFKNHYPENFTAYQKACQTEQIQAGKMFVFVTGNLLSPKWIINFPTKRHWRGKSRIGDIESGLDDLIRVIEQNNIQSIAIPPLGSGLGGLDWQTVKHLIEAKLSPLKSVQVLIYEPHSSQQEKPATQTPHLPRMTAGRATLIIAIQEYLNGLLDPFITLLEVHKLMYFMQAAGENLRLNYTKLHYGPYAKNLSHVLNHIEGHFISGYQDGGDSPKKQLSLLPHALEKAHAMMETHPETRVHLDKVLNLIDGFETAYDLELLSSVHWLAVNESIQTPEEMIKAMHAWSRRKQQFSPRQIRLAYERLQQKGWIH